MSEDQPDRDSEHRSLGYRVWLVVAVVVVALVVIAGIAVSVIAGKRTTATVDPSTGKTTTSQVDSADVSVCGIGPVQLAGTQNAAPDTAATSWTITGTTAVPTVKDAGPGRIDSADGYRSCYAHTPLGAVVATYNLIGMGSNGSLQKRLTRDGTTGATAEQITKANPEDPTSTPQRFQLVGFRVVRYTGTQADIDLALRANTSGRYVASVLYLAWDKGDWKVRFNSDGSAMDGGGGAIPNLAGYIAWSQG